MNTLINKMNMQRGILLVTMVIAFSPIFLQAQPYTSHGAAKIEVVGTSNIHDWTLTSPYGTCTGVFAMDGEGVITGLTNLGFTMTVTNLKSTHGNTMDNNAYKAMAADKYPYIKFVSSSTTVKSNDDGSYLITAPGKLSISSGAQDVTLTAKGKVNADKSVSISGSYKLITTDYNVRAISIMLGAIKTKADVVINYTLTMKPQ